MPLPSLGRMWIMSKRYPPEQRARAMKMVLDHLAEYRSVYAACQAIGSKVGVGVESHETRPSAAGWSEEGKTAPLRYVRGDGLDALRGEHDGPTGRSRAASMCDSSALTSANT